MNLYKVTCRNIRENLVELYVANSESQAEAYAKEKYEDEFYSYDAEVVDSVDGYKIIVSR